jgi:hypothetical protein
MPEGMNGYVAVEGYGSRRVRCERIHHGMSIISSEVNGRTHRAFHPTRVTSGSFSIGFAFTSYDEWRDFNEWMKVYAERASSPDGTLPAMRVVVPFAKFDRMAIPSGGIKFGRANTEFMYRSEFSFKGCSDLLDLDGTDLSVISAAYLSTYYTQDGSPGDYLSNYAIASLSEAVGSGSTTYEDALYAPRVPSMPSPDGIPPNIIVGPDGTPVGW